MRRKRVLSCLGLVYPVGAAVSAVFFGGRCDLGLCPAPRVISVCYNFTIFVSVFSQVFLVYAIAITVSPARSVFRVSLGDSSLMGA